MKKFKQYAEKYFHIEKLPPCLVLMEENENNKTSILKVFESDKNDAKFFSANEYYKLISRFHDTNE